MCVPQPLFALLRSGRTERNDAGYNRTQTEQNDANNDFNKTNQTGDFFFLIPTVPGMYGAEILNVVCAFHTTLECMATCLSIPTPSYDTYPQTWKLTHTTTLAQLYPYDPVLFPDPECRYQSSEHSTILEYSLVDTLCCYPYGIQSFWAHYRID